jgi:polyhydroxybutyrate depolymerase
MKKLLLFILVCVLNAPLFAQTTIIDSIFSGGQWREYRLYKPALYNGTKAVPLVLNLHGYSSNSFEQEFYADFKGLADTANFLVLLPNGTIDNQGERFWNVFNNPSAVDDVAFMGQLLDSIEAQYNIDKNRIYSTGMSNGGFMSYALACELNDRITAIASVTGSMTQSNLNACVPGRPVPVMQIHGTADDVVSYTGNNFLGFVAIPTLVNKWVTLNGCNTTPIQENVPDINTTDNCTAERFLYTGGFRGATVEHYKVNGGGHTWPGTAFSFIGVTNGDFKASNEIWRFFNQYRLNTLTDTRPIANDPTLLRIMPNPAHDHFMVQSNNGITMRQIRTYNIMGQLIADTSTSEGSTTQTISTAGWTKGMYIVRVTAQNGTEATQTIVVE